MHPRQFLVAFVLPALAEWRAEPLSIRKATIALSEIDNLAEHFILFTNPNIPRDQMSSARTALGAAHPLLAVVRDVHDTHKHGALNRRSALIKQGQRPIVVNKDSHFDPAWFAPGWFSTGTPILQITLDDGTVHDLPDVIEGAIRCWLQMMAATGL